MFFKNGLIVLFVRFLWVGLVLGVVSIVVKIVSKIFRKNVFIVNILSFLFWITFGCLYILMCFKFNDYSFSGVGLSAMVLGVLIIKISIEFFFDYFLRFIYNEVSLLKRKNKNGKLQTDEKV